MKVLFVCTGNTCRSPMAQAVYQALSGEEARSGGLGVSQAQPMSEAAQWALNQMGISDFSHCSRQVTPQDLAWADRVYVMTDLHRRILETVCPEYCEKIMLLGGDREISDPFGGSREEYLACLKEIERCIRERVT